MMQTATQTVDARWIGQSFAADRELGLPERPRLIPELLVLPYGVDGLLFVGAQSRQVIRGRSVTSVLRKVLPRLDGRARTEELATPRSLKMVRDVVALLFSRGLLEDGVVETADDAVAAARDSFFGRMNDVTRCNRNRSEAVARLAASTVVIHASDPAAEAVGDFATQLRVSGVGEVRLESAESSKVADLSILISSGDQPPSNEALRSARATGTRLFWLRMGSAEAHIGPTFIRGYTSCETCFAGHHPHPTGALSTLLARQWTALAALQVVNSLARLAPTLSTREFRVLRFEPSTRDHELGDLVEESRVAPRGPGCSDCGLEGSEMAHDDPRLRAWLYHFTTILPPRDMLSPKDHQGHYSSTNIKLATEERRRLFHRRFVDLPQPLALTARPPWVSGPVASVDPRKVADSELARLATVLARTAGEIEEGGKRRRLAPTGGNLGSVDLWVVTTGFAGLERGVYHYYGPRHLLEWSRQLEDGDLASLGLPEAPAGEPDTASRGRLLVFGTGDLSLCARKYQSFAYRLVHLDSGVALSYLHTVADAVGWRLDELPDTNDLAVADLLGFPPRWEFPLPTFAVAVAAADAPALDRPRLTSGLEKGTAGDLDGDRLVARDFAAEQLDAMLAHASRPVRRPRTAVSQVTVAETDSFETTRLALPTLDPILRARRSVRHYAATPLPPSLLADVVRGAWRHLQQRQAAGAAPSFVRLFLGVARGQGDLPAGLYQADAESDSLSRRCDFNPDLLLASINQASLATAPAALFAVTDLGAALEARDVRGYREQAQHAGAAVGRAWLTATGYGLVGCAAGGVIADGLRQAAGMDGFSECPLLALFLGHPGGELPATAGRNS